MSSNLDVGPFGGGNTAVFQDVQANGVNGQNIDSNSDQVVQFNTEVIGKSFVSLSSNQFTFDEGKYRIAININGSDQNNPKAIQVWINDTSNVSYNGTSLLSGNLSSMGYTLLYIDLVIPSGGKTVEVLARTNTGELRQNSEPNPTNGPQYYQKMWVTKVG